jgi:uncharacterized damage-inducible protein DinB
MDVIGHLRRQLAYDDWANRETLASVRSASAPTAVALLAHLISAEALWLDRMAHKPQVHAVWPKWTLDECAQRLDELGTAWKNFLRFLEPQALETSISYVNTKGAHYQSSVRDIVSHVLHHASYHRGQIAAALRAAGATPAYTDFIHAVREGCLDAGGD